MRGYPENTTYHITTEEIIDVCKRQGFAFESSVDLTIGAGESLKTVFKVGSKPVILYSRRLCYSGEGINAYVYRDPTYTGGVESVAINNPNDINPIANESVFLSDADITNDGTLSRAPVYAFSNISQQGQGALLESIEDPQKIPPNAEILFVLENRDAQSQQLSSIIQWVEADRIPGLVLNDDGTFNRYNGKQL